MQIVKIKFLKNDVPTGRGYSYFSNEVLVVGDTVQINESAKGVVVEVDVPESEIEAFRDAVKTIVGKVSTFYFTFGGDQEHAGHYVKIAGTFSSARLEMCNQYGEKWAFQYTEDKWKEWEIEAKTNGLHIETELQKAEVTTNESL